MSDRFDIVRCHGVMLGYQPQLYCSSQPVGLLLTHLGVVLEGPSYADSKLTDVKW